MATRRDRIPTSDCGILLQPPMQGDERVEYLVAFELTRPEDAVLITRNRVCVWRRRRECDEKEVKI